MLSSGLNLTFISYSSCVHFVNMLWTFVCTLCASRVHLVFISWSRVHLAFISRSSRVHLVQPVNGVKLSSLPRAMSEAFQATKCNKTVMIASECLSSAQNKRAQHSSTLLISSNRCSTLLNHSTVLNPPGLSRWQRTGSQRALRAAPTVKQWDPARFSARKRKKLPGPRWFWYVWIQFGFSLDDCNQF